MSFDDDFASVALPGLFEEFGLDATVRRGAGDAVPARIIVRRDAPQLGEFGQVVALVTTVDFMVSQWEPEQGDLVAWSDRFGTHSRRIAREPSNDGFVARAVLNG